MQWTAARKEPRKRITTLVLSTLTVDLCWSSSQGKNKGNQSSETRRMTNHTVDFQKLEANVKTIGSNLDQLFLILMGCLIFCKYSVQGLFLLFFSYSHYFSLLFSSYSLQYSSLSDFNSSQLNNIFGKQKNIM